MKEEMPRILTWDGNPDHYAFTRADAVPVNGKAFYAADVERTAAGEPTNPVRWDVGNSSADVRNGTRVFLLRQGGGPRGIVAAGHVVNGTNREGQHWSDPGRRARYIDVVFDRVLDADEPLPVADLERFIPVHAWSGAVHRQSGRALTSELAAALLETLWAHHLNRSPAQREEWTLVAERMGRQDA